MPNGEWRNTRTEDPNSRKLLEISTDILALASTGADSGYRTPDGRALTMNHIVPAIAQAIKSGDILIMKVADGQISTAVGVATFKQDKGEYVYPVLAIQESFSGKYTREYLEENARNRAIDPESIAKKLYRYIQNNVRWE